MNVVARSRESEVTRDSLLAQLEEAFSISKNAKNGSAMASCIVAKARICGLIIDRREVGEVGAFAGLTDDELVAEAAKRAARLGLAGPQLVVDNKPDVDNEAG